MHLTFIKMVKTAAAIGILDVVESSCAFNITHDAATSKVFFCEFVQ